MSELISDNESNANPECKAKILRAKLLDLAGTIFDTARHARPAGSYHLMGRAITYNIDFHRLATSRIRLEPEPKDGLIQPIHDVQNIDVHVPWDKGYFTDSEGKLKLVFLRERLVDGTYVRHAVTRKQFLSYPDDAELIIPWSVFELGADEPIDGLSVEGGTLDFSGEFEEDFVTSEVEERQVEDREVEDLDRLVEVLHSYRIPLNP